MAWPLVSAHSQSSLPPPTKLSQLRGDVDLTTAPPTNGQFLKWNGAKWVPGTVDLSTYATTGTNSFSGQQTITGGNSLRLINGGGNAITFNMSSGQASGPFSVNLPTIAANDTIATLGVNQTWTGVNTFQGQINGIPGSGIVVNPGGGTITSDSPFTINTTWNSSGTTFTAFKMSVTDTASATGSMLLDLQVGGTSRLNVTKAGKIILGGGVNNHIDTASGDLTLSAVGAQAARINSGTFSVGPQLTMGASPGSADVWFNREAANVVALRNSTNAQTFNIYNTYTNASNYELGGLRWNGNTLELRTAAAGTGTVRNIELLYGSGGNYSAEFTSAGIALQFSGSTRVSFAYNGVDIGANDNTKKGRISALGGTTDGVFAISNGAGTDFNRLQLGGITSSFPAIKRSAAGIQFRLADDSGDAVIQSSYHDLMPQAAPATPGTANSVRIYASSADGKLHAIDSAGVDHALW